MFQDRACSARVLTCLLLLQNLELTYTFVMSMMWGNVQRKKGKLLRQVSDVESQLKERAHGEMTRISQNICDWDHLTL